MTLDIVTNYKYIRYYDYYVPTYILYYYKVKIYNNRIVFIFILDCLG